MRGRLQEIRIILPFIISWYRFVNGSILTNSSYTNIVLDSTKALPTNSVILDLRFQNISDDTLVAVDTLMKENLCVTSITEENSLEDLLVNQVKCSVIFLESTELLNQVEQMKLVKAGCNYWFISKEIVSQDWKLTFEENIDSKVFIYKLDGDKLELEEVYLAHGVQVRRRICRTKSLKECHLDERLSFRKDLSGLVIKTVSGVYSPFSMLDEGKKYIGIVPEIMNILAKNLNFTYVIDHSNSWGSLLTNGSWSGMMGKDDRKSS